LKGHGFIRADKASKMARLQPLRDVFSLHCALASDFFSKLFSRAERGGKIEGF
jgi:hypothetical protein